MRSGDKGQNNARRSEMKKMMAGVIVTVLMAANVGWAEEPPMNAE
jgi:hypothetical protein